ncbi:MAG: putative Fe-S cluster assembly protein SufT [Myxococcota bacterium]
MNEPIEVARELSVIQIPDGTPLVIPAGTRGWVMQVLGGNFTVRLDTGHLVRVNGADAEAIGRQALSTAAASEAAPDDLEAQVWGQLKTCFDPEIPVNIVDLGLIYGLTVKDSETAPGKVVEVTMTLTAPGCGMGQVLKDDVEAKVKTLPGVVEAKVELVFDPPWGPDRMSEEAQLELGMY